MRIFFTTNRRDAGHHERCREITEEQAQALENTGAGHVVRGNNEGFFMMPGPGNCWIETVEGNCPHCGCMAKLHTKRNRDFTAPIESGWDWGTECTGCGCREDIPHGKVESVLGACETF
jgi:hypothetical protein